MKRTRQMTGSEEKIMVEQVGLLRRESDKEIPQASAIRTHGPRR